MANYLIEVDVFDTHPKTDGVAGPKGLRALRYAMTAATTRPTDIPKNETYLPRLKDAGGVEWGMEDDGAQYAGGDLVLNNADGKLDGLRDYGWGRSITIRDVRDPAASLIAAPVVFRGTVDGVDTDDGWSSVRLKIRDRLSDLDKALLTETYAGTTITNGPTAEGTEDLKGQIKPRVFGNVQFMSAILVNPFDMIYQPTASSAQSIKVYDGGLPLSASGDYPTIEALQSAIIERGNYATCLSRGLFRLGGVAARAVTCDVVVGASRSAAAIASAVLDIMGIASADRVASSFAALQSRNQAELGLLVADGSSAIMSVQRVLASVGATLVPDALGRFGAVSRLAPSGAPVLRVTMRNLISRDSIAIANGTDGTPVWKATVNYGRIYRPLSLGDLNGRVAEESAERADRLGKETLPAVSENAAVKDVHPRAREVVEDSLMVHQADAEARSRELLARESVLQTRIVVGVPEDIARGVTPGQIIEIDIPRFGLAGGRLFQVESRKDDWQRRQTFLTSWR